MGNNTPSLGNSSTANNGWTLPHVNANPAAPQASSIPLSGIPEIDNYLNTTRQYAANTINNLGLDLTTQLNNNKSISNLSLFKIVTPSQTYPVVVPSIANSGAAFIPNNTVLNPQGFPPVTTNGDWNGYTATANPSAWASIAADLGKPSDVPTQNPSPTPSATEKPKTSELTMEQIFAQVAKPMIDEAKAKALTDESSKTPTTPPQTVADIIINSRTAIAGSNGAVFGSTNNALRPTMPTDNSNSTSIFTPIGRSSAEAATLLRPRVSNDLPSELYIMPSNTPSSFGIMTSSTDARARLANQAPDLIRMYDKEMAEKAGKQLPANAQNSLFMSENQLGQADLAQKNETLRLVNEAFNAISKDVPKKS